MKILFIKLKFIGDTLLLTPTLVAARRAFPDAQIWAVVRRGCEGILAGCPAVDRVLVTASAHHHLRSRWDWLQDMAVMAQIAAQRFDFAFELGEGDRGRRMAALSAAGSRCARQTPETERWLWRHAFNRLVTIDVANLHRVQWDYQTVRAVLPLQDEIPPLSFVNARTRAPSGFSVEHPCVVIHPFPRVAFRKWPAERWVALGRWLAMEGFQVLISSGPSADEVAEAERLRAEIGGSARSTRGKLDWAELAFILYQAKLFVGVDTSVMHLAAACDCPTVAIFGKAITSEWRPWKVRHRLIAPPDELVQIARAKSDPEIAQSITSYVGLEPVQAACEELLISPRLKVPLGPP